MSVQSRTPPHSAPCAASSIGPAPDLFALTSRAGVLVVVVGVCLGCAKQPPRELVILAGRLLDGSGGAAQDRMRVFIQDGGVVAIKPHDNAPLPPGAIVLDAQQLTVLPGIIDAHTHLLASPGCAPSIGAGLGQGVRNLRALLRSGVTTVAETALPPRVAIGLRRYVGTARHRGPRVLVAGPALTAPLGHLTKTHHAEFLLPEAVRTVDSPRQARTTVRELAETGVDFIKVTLQQEDRVGGALRILNKETLCALTKEAHKQELRVLVRATSKTGYRLALECQADALLGGSRQALEDDLLQSVAAAQIPVAPALWALEAPFWGPEHPELLNQAPLSQLLTRETRADLHRYIAAYRASSDLLPLSRAPGVPRAREQQASATVQRNVRRLHEAGAALGFGTEGGGCFQALGSPVRELERLVQSGLSPTEALRVATHGGASMLALGEAIGRIGVGYRADIIAVAGEPDHRIGDIQNVRLVLIDGVVQRFDAPSLLHAATLWVHVAWARLTL